MVEKWGELLLSPNNLFEMARANNPHKNRIASHHYF
jgi:hypothetical protein